MNKTFKLGDRVRYIGPTSGGFTKGKIYIADQYVDKPGEFARLGTWTDDNGSCNGHDQKHFELVTSNESELERLVRVANEGALASYRLRTEFGHEIEFKNNGSYKNWTPCHEITFSGTTAEYRIKQKPKFEPFVVGSGWQVKLEGDMLHIGCQKFNATSFKKAVKGAETGLITDRSVLAGVPMTGSRSGIEWDGHRMLWSDADKILAALEKAGI
jgi:hypothetical protein